MNTTYVDPTRTYKKPTQQRTGEYTVTLEKNGERWMTRINGGFPFPSTEVEIYLWKQLLEKSHEHGA